MPNTSLIDSWEFDALNLSLGLCLWMMRSLRSPVLLFLDLITLSPYVLSFHKYYSYFTFIDMCISIVTYLLEVKIF